MPDNKKGDDSPERRTTRHLRARVDLMDMISDICDATGRKMADYVDPLLRPQVLADFARFKPQIEKRKKAREEARRKEEEPG